MSLDLSSLTQAIDALENSVALATSTVRMAPLDDITKATIRAGVIQHFELTYELCWKFTQRWIRSNISPEDAIPRSKKDLFRTAAQKDLISDPKDWFDFTEAGNKTSHTYNREIADEVFGVALRFLPAAKELLAQLNQAND